MTIKQEDIHKVAELARLGIEQGQMDEVCRRINTILQMADALQAVDTAAVEPLSNPLEVNALLREDIVTEINQRDVYQAIAPATESGLYLVPKVIE